MACRSLLSKLARLSYITLPAGHPYGGRHPPSIPDIPHRTDPVSCPLSRLTPLRLEVVEGDPLLPLFKCLLSRYHYLGFQGNVGENLKYMVFDREQNPLACLLFGSASWKNAPRDDFIGWDAAARETNLYLVTANMRFLVLPWVRVPHLASHILGMVVRDISKEWVKKYGHPIHLVETFVERGRFQGICYQAANWVLVGQTRGRSRNDRARTLRVPIKDVYLYRVDSSFPQSPATSGCWCRYSRCLAGRHDNCSTPPPSR